jgi:hypothetical protein
LGLLGDVLDKLGRYGEAFAAYVEGNNTVSVSLQEKFAPRGEPIILLQKALAGSIQILANAPAGPPLRPYYI